MNQKGFVSVLAGILALSIMSLGSFFVKHIKLPIRAKEQTATTTAKIFVPQVPTTKSKPAVKAVQNKDDMTDVYLYTYADIKANGVEDWLKQTNDVTVSWASQAKQCTLSLEDEAFLVPGIGTKDFKLNFSSNTAHHTFWLICMVNGKSYSDNVTVGGSLQ
jgi:hypothetical protein